MLLEEQGVGDVELGLVAEVRPAGRGLRPEQGGEAVPARGLFARGQPGRVQCRGNRLQSRPVGAELQHGERGRK